MSSTNSTRFRPQLAGLVRGAWVLATLWGVALLGAGTASAKPELVLEWVGVNGQGIAPAADIAVREGDEVELQITLVPDEAGIKAFGFGIQWDRDGQKELSWQSDAYPMTGTPLTLVTSDLVVNYASVRDPGGIGVWGERSSIRGCSNPPNCDPGAAQAEFEPFVIGTILYEVTEYLHPDFNDVEVVFGLDSWIDGSGEDLCMGLPSPDCVMITTASVPEPADFLMQITALLVLGGVLKRRAAIPLSTPLRS